MAVHIVQPTTAGENTMNKRNGLMTGLLAGAVAAAVTVAAVAPAQAGSATYSYDSLGRLVKVVYSNGAVITYTYDAAGNRTAAVVTGAAS